MSTRKYEPPEFFSDPSGYAEYKKKLERWSRITAVQKDKQAEVVVYHLEGHPSGIQEKIDTAIGSEIQDKATGLATLIKYLDGIYAEDDMTTAWTSYKRFVRLVKTEEQQVTEFIAEFEKEYKKAKECGCVFSDTVLAFSLLEACKLSDVDEKFVLTAIDFKVGKEKKDLLDQVKTSLRKFQSREKVSVGARSEDKIKVDESLVASVKHALMSEGWKGPRRRSYSDSDTEGLPRNSGNYKGRKNPLGSDGKPLKCFDCQSEYHMRDKCDKEKGNDSKDEKNEKKDKKDKKEKREKGDKKKNSQTTMLTTLLKSRKKVEFTMMAGSMEAKNEDPIFATHAVHELAYLMEGAGIRGVLDSGCSKSVAGVKWLEKFSENLPEEVSSSLKVEESRRVYQFGGGETRCSHGCVRLPTMMGDKKVHINVEIVEAEIPLLIGCNSMQGAKAQLDFGNMRAVFFEEEIQMFKIGSGLFSIDLVAENIECHINNIEDRDAAVEQAVLAAECIDEKTLKKLHHLFGHTSAEKLLAFVQKTGKCEKGTRKVLKKIGQTCDACVKSAEKKLRPKSDISRVDKPNQIVIVDLNDYDATDTNSKKLFIDQGARVGEEFWRVENLSKEDEIVVEENQEESEESSDEKSSDEDIQSGISETDTDSSDAVGSGEETVDNEVSENEAEEVINHVNDENANGVPNPPRTFSFTEIQMNDTIKYKFMDSDLVTATVQSRADKSSGSTKYWRNLKVEDTGEEKAVNTKNFEAVEKVIDKSQDEIEEVLVVVIPRHLRYQTTACGEANEKEHQEWDNFGVYEEVTDEGQKTFKYDGMQVVQHAQSISVNFDHYGDNIEIPSLDAINELLGDNLVDEETRSDFRSIVGKLGWLAKNFRPDLGFVISTKLGKVTASDLNDTLDEMVYVREVLKEALGGEADMVPFDLYADSRNLYKSVMSTTLNENLRFRTDVAKLQDSLKAGELERFTQISGQEILDCSLTKKGASSEKFGRRKP